MALRVEFLRSRALGIDRWGLALTAMFVALIPVACDEYVTVSGVVSDPSGLALHDVAIVLRTPGREPHVSRTAEDGSFKVGIVGADPRNTRVAVRKEGFEEFERELGKETRVTMAITLSPKVGR